MVELDHDEWKEIRGRVDSLANAVFLIAGGALTLSVSSLLRFSQEIGPELKTCISLSWQILFGSIVGFILLKVSLIAQSYMRCTLRPEQYNRINGITNSFGWTVGLLALLLFIVGMYMMFGVALVVIFPT
ncbi:MULTISPECIES: hypothetical protein [unclassified Marinimicrobium]|uniref:hypothetical protein n=1 Tax=Marinimicrobium TaxID=359337 RepID=UPI00257C06E1|nr:MULTISPECIES: hypothetical protein [unclassified Marinimicrobium]